MKARGVVLSKLLDRVRTASDKEDAVITFNAVALPDMCCGLDKRGMLHLTLIGAGRTLDEGPAQVMHTADFIWSYDPVTEKYTNLKDRTGEFS